MCRVEILLRKMLRKGERWTRLHSIIRTIMRAVLVLQTTLNMPDTTVARNHLGRVQPYLIIVRGFRHHLMLSHLIKHQYFTGRRKVSIVAVHTSQIWINSHVLRGYWKMLIQWEIDYNFNLISVLNFNMGCSSGKVPKRRVLLYGSNWYRQ